MVGNYKTVKPKSAEVRGMDQPIPLDYTGEIIKKRRVSGWIYKREMQTGLIKG
jgi:hypothetical protein